MIDATAETAPDNAGRSRSWRLFRRIVVLLIGVPVTLAGLILLVTPGPGTPILIGGLAILATEFAVARRQLDRVKRLGRRVMGREQENEDPGA
jgi:hypothetical protein